MAFSPGFSLSRVWPVNAHSTATRVWLSPPVVSQTLSASRRLSSPCLFSAQYNYRHVNGDFVSSMIRSLVSTYASNGGEETEDHSMDSIDVNEVKPFLFFSLLFLRVCLILKYSFL